MRDKGKAPRRSQTTVDQPRPSPGDDGPKAAHTGYVQYGTKGKPQMTNAGGLKGRTDFTAKDLERGHKKLGRVDVLESPTGRRSRDSNPNQDTIENTANK